VYPLVIMFSVPLAAVGGLLGLAVVRQFDPTQQLDVLTMLGFVILIGIVVNNAILIVHQSLNFMRGEGHGVGDHLAGEKLGHREAIMEAVRTRMRPIMMTTLTSVCGMLPLVLSRFVSFGSTSAGSELYTGLGSVVIGGLVVATLFTLIVVPLVFSLTLDLQSGVLKLVQWSDQGVTSDTSTDV
jgi:hydrophobic/amphiphilic exporter-1 (mainly G- bacteria), HAE1 family